MRLQSTRQKCVNTDAAALMNRGDRIFRQPLSNLLVFLCGLALGGLAMHSAPSTLRVALDGVNPVPAALREFGARHEQFRCITGEPWRDGTLLTHATLDRIFFTRVCATLAC
jgi:hypothetical protein